MVAGRQEQGVPFPFISEDADEALELIFEHASGIASHHLARTLGLKDCAFLIEELHLAGILIRRQMRDDILYFLAPLRHPPKA